MTPEQFMTQPADLDDLDGADSASADGGADPLTSIAESLRALVQVAAAYAVPDGVEGAPSEADELRQALDQADAEHAALLARHTDLVEQVRALVKPSTSKLANSIRAALDPGTPSTPAEGSAPGDDGSDDGPEPADEGDVQTPPPAPDADVAQWRSYAYGLGHDFDVVGGLNRSQIRSLIGLPQPVTAAGA